MLSNSIHIGRRGVSLGGGSSAPAWSLAGGAPAPVAAYQPKGAASQAASYVNLANPGTYNAAPGVAPTWDTTTGWTFDGATQYLTTGIVPASNQTWTLIVRFDNALASGGFVAIAGAGWAGGQGLMLSLTHSLSRRSYYNGGLLHITGFVTNGVLAAAGNKGYYNGTADAGTIGTSATPNTYALAIGALNQTNSIVSFFNGRVQAVAAYSSVLTAGQVAAVSAAMSAL